MPFISHGRCGKRGGSPKREKKTCGVTMGFRRDFRRKLALFCRRWHNAQPADSDARVPDYLIKRFKEAAGITSA